MTKQSWYEIIWVGNNKTMWYEMTWVQNGKIGYKMAMVQTDWLPHINNNNINNNNK